MQAQQIDYRMTFKVSPGSVALLSPDAQILDVNDGWLESTTRQRADIVGRNIFDVLPQNPASPDDSGPAALRATLQAALRSGKPDIVPLGRYDIEDPNRPGVFEQRFWSAVTTPVLDNDGHVTMIVLWTQEVTHVVSQIHAQEVRHS